MKFDKRQTSIGAKGWVKFSGWPMGIWRFERALGVRRPCLVTRDKQIAQVIDSVDRIGSAGWRLAITCF